MILYTCPTCKAVLQSPGHTAGYKAACPKCDHWMTVPRPAKPAAADLAVFYTCPTCKAILQSPAVWPGYKVPCSKCDQWMTVPRPATLSVENPEEANFLLTIRKQPNDNAPRLIYADWLEERGKEDRAVFIRLQCVLEDMDWNHPQRAELQAKADRLLTEHREEWLAQLCAVMPMLRDEDDIIFTRGFLSVTLHRVEDLEYTAGLPSVALLLEVCLDLYGNAIGDEGVQALARSPFLQNLTQLDLFDNDIGDAGVRALAQSRFLQNVTHLDLIHHGISDAGVRALAGSSHLQNLTTLNLGGNNISPRLLDEIERLLAVRRTGSHGAL
jgi:uncharacterized protein (TIGR02996 family)